jgi:uncharacterized protein YdaU (DUF1376 family)
MARPWYAFYPADYARDTGDLSILEHGAYRLLMDHYYSTGEPLSTDVDRLLRLCRATVESERAAVHFVLDKFFALGDDGYHHVRIDAELIKAAEKAEKCSRAGTVSATKRQQVTQQNGNGRSTEPPTEVQPSQSQSQSHKKKEPALTRFDDFWAVCPKKTGRGDAERAWPKACKLAAPDTLIAAMRAYAATQPKDRTFTKTPGPWLNGKHWLDEGIAPVAAAEPVEVDASWGSDAERLAEAIEHANFNAYFAAAKFEAGPPARILMPKKFLRDRAALKFGTQLRKCFGEVILETAA